MTDEVAYQVPDIIYLQIKDLGGITWCVDRINDTDIEYVRVDRGGEQVSGMTVDGEVLPPCKEEA